MRLAATTAAAVTATGPALCAKCEGTGLFYTRTGTIGGTCFACSGRRFTGLPRAPKPEAPKVEADALVAAFRRAKDSGLKYPRIRLSGMAITMANAQSANAGALYVKQGSGQDGAYLGKIMGGRFMKSAACSEEQQARVLSLLANPLDEAVAQGKETGACCMCGLELTDPESIERGIGPICAERWFGA